MAWLCWEKYLEVGSQEINVHQGLVHNCSLDMHSRVLECGQRMLEEFPPQTFPVSGSSGGSTKFGVGLVFIEEEKMESPLEKNVRYGVV